MAAAIRKRDDEIRSWNAELQDRVAHKTRELRDAQDQILRSRRLAALGSLGAGIAHEVNNPLTAVTGLLALLKAELPKDSEQARTAQTALAEAYRVAAIVKKLKTFADESRSEGRPFPLEGPVRSALDHHAQELQEKNIRVEADFASRLRPAQGDPAQIEQVVSHLVRNAIQAMPRGGELKLSVNDVGGEALQLRVQDNGKGIPAQFRERIFDPFFSTKSDGTQAGLGLSLSHRIVEAHHGRIVVDSEEGKGATFTVFLPAAAPAAHLV
jgi:two-component system, NtrC family, sensor kinase